MEERAEYQALSDEEVARRVSVGDRDALAALYQRHVDALYDYLARTLKDPGAAEDAVQTTYVKAWASLTSRPRAFKSVRAWLFTIARNVAIDEIRRRRRVIPSDPTDPEFVAVDESRLADPDAVVHDRELAELVWRSASALSPDDYALLHLWVREGLSVDELAEVSGVRKGAM